MKTRLYCHDFIDAGLPNKCCDSCHEDAALGYEMIDLEVDGHPEIDAHICCGMARVIQDSTEPPRTLFARALLARRERERIND